MKKQTKDERIDFLQASLLEKKEVNARLSHELTQIERAVFDNSSYTLSPENIIKAINQFRRDIIKLRGQVDTYRETQNERSFMLEEENSKLWYLVRAINKDETLKNDGSHFDGPIMRKSNPFKPPHF